MCFRLLTLLLVVFRWISPRFLRFNLFFLESFRGSGYDSMAGGCALWSFHFAERVVDKILVLKCTSLGEIGKELGLCDLTTMVFISFGWVAVAFACLFIVLDMRLRSSCVRVRVPFFAFRVVGVGRLFALGLGATPFVVICRLFTPRLSSGALGLNSIIAL